MPDFLLGGKGYNEDRRVLTWYETEGIFDRCPNFRSKDMDFR